MRCFKHAFSFYFIEKKNHVILFVYSSFSFLFFAIRKYRSFSFLLFVSLQFYLGSCHAHHGLPVKTCNYLNFRAEERTKSTINVKKKRAGRLATIWIWCVCTFMHLIPILYFCSLFFSVNFGDLPIYSCSCIIEWHSIRWLGVFKLEKKERVSNANVSCFLSIIIKTYIEHYIFMKWMKQTT